MPPHLPGEPEGTPVRRGASRRLSALAAFLAVGACALGPQPAIGGAEERRLFTEIYESITDYYVEPASADRLSLAGLRRLTALDPEFVVARAGDALVLRRGLDERRLAVPEAEDAAGWAGLTAEAIDWARRLSPALAALEADRIADAVIEGGTATLDRFSHYARPDLAQERRAARDGFGGIGVTLDLRAGEVRVAAVIPDTPAAGAGLRVDDRIVSVDGVATRDLSVEEVRRRLRGAADSTVSLGVARRADAAPVLLALRRTYIVEPTVTLAVQDGIAVLRITSFNQQTAPQLADLLHQAHRENGAALRGIVLDLRDNPGGLLDQSVAVASLFLDGGSVVSTVGRNPHSFQHFVAPPGRQAEHLPLAVLVNGGSASAAEIVAAALQDTGRAVVIGTASYGKGTVQTVLRMPNDGELAVTWAKLVTPRGYLLHQHGVVPTICTAERGGEASAADLVERAGSAPATRREALDEAGWRALRDGCPPARQHPGLDLEVAQQLLANPTLYGRVIDPAPTRDGGSFKTAHARP